METTGDYVCWNTVDLDYFLYGGRGGNSSGSSTNSESCIPSVFNPSCKPPSCLAVFANAASDALPELPEFPPGLRPHDAVNAAAGAIAIKHIVNRGLVSPLSSSIVRNILAGGELASSVVLYLPVIYQGVVGLKAEYKAIRSGSCQKTIP